MNIMFSHKRGEMPMKKTTGAMCIAILLLVGCAKQFPVTTTMTKNAPEWIDKEDFSAELITAVGIAQKNPLDDKGLQRSEALVDSRVKMAAKISARAQGVFAQLNKRLTHAAQANVSGGGIRTESMSRTVEETRRQMVDQALQGAVPQAFWTDPADGTLYVLLGMNRKESERAMERTVQTIRKELDLGARDLQGEMRRMQEGMKEQGAGNAAN